MLLEDLTDGAALLLNDCFGDADEDALCYVDNFVLVHILFVLG